VTGLLAALGLRLAAIAVQPIAAAYRSSRDIQVLEKEYAAVRQRNEWLQNRVRYLNTPAGIEEEARRQGWVRAGEVRLRIVPLEALSQGTPHAPSARSERLLARPMPPAAALSAPPARPLAPPSGSVRFCDRPEGDQPTIERERSEQRARGAAEPRSATAERIQQFLATWGPTRWIGELFE
jgi:cell division protein FtsB